MEVSSDTETVLIHRIEQLSPAAAFTSPFILPRFALDSIVMIITILEWHNVDIVNSLISVLAWNSF